MFQRATCDKKLAFKKKGYNYYAMWHQLIGLVNGHN